MDEDSFSLAASKLGLARTKASENKLAESGVLYHEIIQLTGEVYPEAFYWRGRWRTTILQPPQYDLGLEDYDTAIRLEPRHFMSYVARAELHFRMGRNEESLADYRKSLELNPNFGMALTSIGEILVMRTGRLDEALEVLTGAVEKYRLTPGSTGDPERWKVFFLALKARAMAFYGLERFAEGAVDLAEYLSCVNPASLPEGEQREKAEMVVGRVHLARGMCYLRCGRIVDAIDDFDAGLGVPELPGVEGSRGGHVLSRFTHGLAKRNRQIAVEKLESRARVLVERGDQGRQTTILTPSLADLGANFTDDVAVAVIPNVIVGESVHDEEESVHDEEDFPSIGSVATPPKLQDCCVTLSFKTLRFLFAITTNILRHSDSPKFRKLNLSKAVLAQHIAAVPEAMFLLRSVGFISSSEVPSSPTLTVATQQERSEFSLAPDSSLEPLGKLKDALVVESNSRKAAETRRQAEEEERRVRRQAEQQERKKQEKRLKAFDTVRRRRNEGGEVGRRRKRVLAQIAARKNPRQISKTLGLLAEERRRRSQAGRGGGGSKPAPAGRS